CIICTTYNLPMRISAKPATRMKSMRRRERKTCRMELVSGAGKGRERRCVHVGHMCGRHESETRWIRRIQSINGSIVTGLEYTRCRFAVTHRIQKIVLRACKVHGYGHESEIQDNHAAKGNLEI